MPAVYENTGIRFLYPENWSITEEEIEEWPRNVTLQSPDTGFWSLQVFPPGHEPRPSVQEMIGSLREIYGEIEVLPVKETYGDTETKGVDLAFFYLDLMIESKIRTLRTPSSTLIWQYQAESREFDDLEAVFQAISTSLLATQVSLESPR
ncbi:MAG: hypothetical protein SFU86_25035 [Pirellulaceae bacterium]|nr:hypothetical protein [Pirellulaceae bacterium]